MKIITMYELLGLVKDGKAPKKVKYDYHYYIYDENYDTYYQEMSGGNQLRIIVSELNAEVEILEEEKKIPEKFKVHSFGDKDENGCFVSSPFPTDEEFMNKINDIIDYLDYLKSKGE